MKKSNWISCDDRLPDLNVPVFTINVNEKNVNGDLMVTAETMKDVWRSCHAITHGILEKKDDKLVWTTCVYDMHSSNAEVTHWMEIGFPK